MVDPRPLPGGGGQDVFFPRSGAADLPTIVRGDGIHLIDDRGRHLLDVASGPFLASLGQGDERVRTAMLEHGRRLTYTYSRTTRHRANAALAERLAALAGPGFERVHLRQRAPQLRRRDVAVEPGPLPRTSPAAHHDPGGGGGEDPSPPDLSRPRRRSSGSARGTGS